jgi:hypothetical protein
MGNEVIRSCLLRQRLRLELYVLDGNKWVLGRRGSPGNIGAFEEECLVNGELPPDASTGACRGGKRGVILSGPAAPPSPSSVFLTPPSVSPSHRRRAPRPPWRFQGLLWQRALSRSDACSLNGLTPPSSHSLLF